MKRVLFICQKGGTGKTAAALQLVAHMARFHPSKRGLVIDLDSQSNLTEHLAGLEPLTTIDHGHERYTENRKGWPARPLGVLDVLRGTASLQECVRTHVLKPMAGTGAPVGAEADWQHARANTAPKVDYMLAHHNLDGWQIEALRAGKEHALADALETAADSYDWCVIDTPPAAGYLTANGIWAATHVVIVVRPGDGLLRGIEMTQDALGDHIGRRKGMRAFDHLPYELSGVLLNQWTVHAASQRAQLQLAEFFGPKTPLLGPIPNRQSFMSAAEEHVDIYAAPAAYRDPKDDPSAFAVYRALKPIADQLAK